MAHAKELFLYGTLFNILWAKATYYINHAKEIYFIGYGFPESDINNLLMFLKNKKKIKEIIVYYPDKKDEDLNRLIQIFGKKIVKNINALDYLAENSERFCHWH